MISISFQKSLRLVSIIGAGMLVGTALAVIIPEGVHELYNDHAHGGLLFKLQYHSRFQQRLPTLQFLC